MKPDDFRRLALSLPDTIEASHMNHPDFRARGKIFCTLAYPDDTYGMVILTPIDQDLFVQADPNTFMPVPGAWGKQGSTRVHLASARVALVKKALSAAWQKATTARSAKAARKAPVRKKGVGTTVKRKGAR